MLGHFEKRHIKNGTQKLNLEDGSVFYCVQSSIEILREQALHNEIRLEFVHPENNDLTLNFDTARLQLVLVNLINSAIVVSKTNSEIKVVLDYNQSGVQKPSIGVTIKIVVSGLSHSGHTA